MLSAPAGRTFRYPLNSRGVVGRSSRWSYSESERDVLALIDGFQQLVKAPIVLVWHCLNTHVSRAMGELTAERERLTVFLLPAHSPDLNPVEWAGRTASAAWPTEP